MTKDKQTSYKSLTKNFAWENVPPRPIWGVFGEGRLRVGAGYSQSAAPQLWPDAHSTPRPTPAPGRYPPGAANFKKWLPRLRPRGRRDPRADPTAGVIRLSGPRSGSAAFPSQPETGAGEREDRLLKSFPEGHVKSPQPTITIWLISLVYSFPSVLKSWALSLKVRVSVCGSVRRGPRGPPPPPAPLAVDSGETQLRDPNPPALCWREQTPASE